MVLCPNLLPAKRLGRQLPLVRQKSVPVLRQIAGRRSGSSLRLRGWLERAGGDGELERRHRTDHLGGPIWRPVWRPLHL